jgi:hypothetical protein
MLSILVYGRNDAHGYNLHKRVALSLNAMALVLTEPSDEIIFVDYNTPSDLPTFIDAIRDTLTPEALERLRVIRVPAWVHEERFAHRTRLAALEPVARNVGLRRSNPENEWVLSTNTDMLFVPHRSGASLSEAAAKLGDGYYALPRYDIPEALWELMDRRDPVGNLELLREWGPKLHLDSIVLSFTYNGFDAPGDFQLIRRDQMFAMDGFDEEMLHGWHVDSNLFKRLSLVFDRPGDLSPELSGYHCDHTRLATAMHRTGGIQNDLHRFVEDVVRPDLPAQRDVWGLADLELDEVDVRTEAVARISAALARVVPPPRDPTPVVDCLNSYEMMDYDPAHVLPYLIDPLTVLPAHSVVAYVGVNAELAEMLAAALGEIGFTEPLRILDIEGAPRVDQAVPASLADVTTGAEAVVFDFGLLPRVGEEAPATIGGWARPLRWRLSRVLEAFDALISHDRRQRVAGNPRRYLAVNSRATLFEAFFTSRLVTTTTPYNTRTQHGFVADVPDEDVDAVFTQSVRASLETLFGYGLSDVGCLYKAGQTIDFTVNGRSGPFVNYGWGLPEADGTWTVDDRSDLLFEIEPVGAHSGYVCTIESTPFLLPPRHDHVDVDVLVNGNKIGTLAFRSDVQNPPASSFVVDRETIESTAPGRLELAVGAPTSPASLGLNRDGRRLGVMVRSSVIRPRELDVALGERRALDSNAVTDCLAGGWSYPEPTGVWTDGPKAGLLVMPTSVPAGVPVDLAVEIRDAMLTRAHPTLTVDVAIDGVPTDQWVLRDGDPRHQLRRVALGTAEGTAARSIELVIHDPARPVDLAIGHDTRRLGIMISGVSLVRSDAPDPPIQARQPLSRALVRRATDLIARRGSEGAPPVRSRRPES